jgi:hypothetical protein
MNPIHSNNSQRPKQQQHKNLDKFIKRNAAANNIGNSLNNSAQLNNNSIQQQAYKRVITQQNKLLYQQEQQQNQHYKKSMNELRMLTIRGEENDLAGVDADESCNEQQAANYGASFRRNRYRTLSNGERISVNESSNKNTPVNQKNHHHSPHNPNQYHNSHHRSSSTNIHNGQDLYASNNNNNTQQQKISAHRTETNNQSYDLNNSNSNTPKSNRLRQRYKTQTQQVTTKSLDYDTYASTDEDRPVEFSPEIIETADKITYITNHIKSENDYEEVSSEIKLIKHKSSLSNPYFDTFLPQIESANVKKW